ncbi:MAG: NAD-dependent protein deacylase [Theionarchaea archaeon]|nr:NAD-dependent protein deacylase [Theionarchaea archaeon]MBU7038927.1 NAD-dependent protein deacylase [Theionarchaea archaeon]
MESPVDSAVRLLSASDYAVALTGAGISTDSGIPDFRSPGGLWNTFPAIFGDYHSFLTNPEQVLELGRVLLPLLFSAVPNEGHKAMKKLEDLDILQAIITQNIDGLHQMAGSKTVVEIHGTYKTATCLGCKRAFTLPELLPLSSSSLICPDCLGIVKPDVVMFGEPLPEEAFSQAVALTEQADLMIVAGSSLEVIPASHLVTMASRNKVPLIFINKSQTALDKLADIILRETISECLPHLVALVRKEVIPCESQ